MKRNSLGAFIAVNVALLVALLVVLVLPGRPAEAQRGRGRGDYIMVAGRVKGRTNQAGIYIMDLKSYRIAAVLFDSRNQRLETIAGRNMTEDLQSSRRK